MRVTVNDYLAKRDSEWMGRIHHFLGMDVGAILSQMDPADRRRAYQADITYGTTTSSASTICATTWRSASPTAYSASTTTPSSTRSTRS